MYQRDPVSELFDGGAAALLNRAHARRGSWQATLLIGPAPGQLAWAASLGINLLAADDYQPVMNRWDRAFIRSVYHLQRWHMDGHRVNLAVRQPERGGPGALRYRPGRRTLRGMDIRIIVLPTSHAPYNGAPATRRYTSITGPAAHSRSDLDHRDWE